MFHSFLYVELILITEVPKVPNPGDRMKVVVRGRMPRPGRGRPDFDRLGRGSAEGNHQIIPSAFLWKLAKSCRVIP